MKMTAYEPDAEVVLWGVHLINVCFTNNGSSEIVTCYEKDFSRVESVQEGFCDPTDSVVENDEVIAFALQEELSRFATSKTSESEGEQHLDEVPIFAQDWHSNSDYQSNQEEAWQKEAILPDFSQLSVEADDQDVFPEIEDESSLDGELGKRLNQIIPVPFRSLSDQIYWTPDHHKFVREQVINQLKSQPELYENYVPMTYADYLKKMNKSGEWGDNITLQAAADRYGIKIFIITSFKDTCCIEILPQTQKSNRIIFLSFLAEVHYNSIYPLGAMSGKVVQHVLVANCCQQDRQLSTQNRMDCCTLYRHNLLPFVRGKLAWTGISTMQLRTFSKFNRGNVYCNGLFETLTIQLLHLPQPYHL